MHMLDVTHVLKHKLTIIIPFCGFFYVFLSDPVLYVQILHYLVLMKNFFFCFKFNQKAAVQCLSVYERCSEVFVSSFSSENLCKGQQPCLVVVHVNQELSSHFSFFFVFF